MKTFSYIKTITHLTVVSFIFLVSFNSSLSHAEQNQPLLRDDARIFSDDFRDKIEERLQKIESTTPFKVEVIGVSYNIGEVGDQWGVSRTDRPGILIGFERSTPNVLLRFNRKIYDYVDPAVLEYIAADWVKQLNANRSLMISQKLDSTLSYMENDLNLLTKEKVKTKSNRGLIAILLISALGAIPFILMFKPKRVEYLKNTNSNQKESIKVPKGPLKFSQQKELPRRLGGKFSGGCSAVNK